MFIKKFFCNFINSKNCKDRKTKIKNIYSLESIFSRKKLLDLLKGGELGEFSGSKIRFNNDELNHLIQCFQQQYFVLLNLLIYFLTLTILLQW